MGSFRSPGARASDIAVLHSTKTEPRPAGPGVAFTDLLEAGESIVYRTRLPYSAAIEMAQAAATVRMDQRGRLVERTFDAAAASRHKVIAGIVSWDLQEDGSPAPAWDPTRASELLDCIHPALPNHLGLLIDGGSPPDLGQPVDEDSGEPSDDDPDDPLTVTEGKGSAGRSKRS